MCSLRTTKDSVQLDFEMSHRDYGEVMPRTIGQGRLRHAVSSDLTKH